MNVDCLFIVKQAGFTHKKETEHKKSSEKCEKRNEAVDECESEDAIIATLKRTFDSPHIATK
jgi:hypothetical protein